MQLILWRHADAEDNAANDLSRNLTPRGVKQAERAAAWLTKKIGAEALARDWTIVASPANRAVQTASALKTPFAIEASVGPDVPIENILRAAGWPTHQKNVMVVAHQPVLGICIAHLLGEPEGYIDLAKGELWWLQSEDATHSRGSASVVDRIAPDLA
jgi:phosphohistidine phosphatase